MISESKKAKAWLVTVNMGYGHMRAAAPLRDLVDSHYIIANDYPGIPESDKKLWQQSRKFYEAISRIEQVPIIGKPIFSILDNWQEIPSFYPRRDLSEATFQLKQHYKLFEKGLARHLIQHMRKDNLPLVTTFFLPALAAEFYGYPNDIYCVICDTDISRIWVPLEPKKTRIKYFAPCRRVVERLKLYGVPAKNIFLTGFPLPKENVGGLRHAALKADLAARLVNLDPTGIYSRHFGHTLRDLLGKENYPTKATHPLTLTFAVGGAGAQRQMVGDILQSLKVQIREKALRLNLVAGSRPDVLTHFRRTVRRFGMENYLDGRLNIIYASDRNEYFKKFNAALRTTDMLWTKPSELSFYSALGLPIIIAPPIGSQEEFNESWLRSLGSGIPQNDPAAADQWLFDWLRSGWLARAAVAGFVGAVKRGTYRIEEIVAHKKRKLPEPIEPV
ncbi:MAG: hypothetical protein AAB562_00900 [Patescibacteria group bacterium]